jgi:serine/threonine protein kinase
MMKREDDTLLDLEPSFEHVIDRDPEESAAKEFDERATDALDVQALIERVTAQLVDPTSPDRLTKVRAEAKTEPVRAPTPSDHDTEPEVDNERFELLERIGSGAMAEVWRAIDRGLSIEGGPPVFVAIKIFRKDSPFGKQTLDRIKVEARAALRIQSEHVCRVHGLVLFPDGKYGLVMELVEGRSLASILREGVAIDYLRFARWGAEIARGLHAAHTVDVVHRDLKPDNIIIRDSDDSAVILDFGIAKFFQETLDLTEQGDVLGSLPYLAPEQFGEQVDPRTDLYALGLLLARFATGRVPWCGDGTIGSIFNERVTNARVYRLRDELPSAPAEYAMVVGRLLSLRPEDRFHTGVHVAEALVSFIRSAEADTRLRMIGEPSRARDTKPMAQRRPPPTPPIRDASDVVALSRASRAARISIALFIALIAMLVTITIARGVVRAESMRMQAMSLVPSLSAPTAR